MSKQVTNTILQRMLTKTGTEPVIVLGVLWGPAGGITSGSDFFGQTDAMGLGNTNVTPGSSTGVDWYSTKGMPGYRNTILKVGACQNQKRADSSGTIASMSFTMSDADGYMKWIIDNTETERRMARVFLIYPDIGSSQSVELLGGHIAGPVVWSETDRTVTITVESIQDMVEKELGYSATIDDFSDLSPSAEGVAWPMMFGECTHVPALKAREHTVGSLIGAIRLNQKPSYTLSQVSPGPDLPFTYNFQLLGKSTVSSWTSTKNKIYVEDGDKFPQNKTIQISIDGVIFEGKFTSNTRFEVAKSNLPRWPVIETKTRDTHDPDWKNPKVCWIDQSKYNYVLANCHCYFHTVATMQWYNFCITQEGEKCTFKYPLVSPVTRKPLLMGTGYKIDEVYSINKNGMTADVMGPFHRLADANPLTGSGGLINDKMKKLEASPDSWWSAEPETEVKLWKQGDPDIYIASLIELEEIKTVYGRRKVTVPNGKSKTIMDQIPTSYYTIQLRSNFMVGGNYASAILIDPPLADYEQDWEDAVWISGKSTIGPNVSDIIVWMLKNYTSYIPDSSFDIFRTATQSEPANFALFDQGNPVDVATRITFQARGALILDSYSASVRYIASPPQIAFNFDRSNILKDSLELGFTEISDIQTKTVFTWTPGYRESARLSKIRQTNISEVENIVKSLVPSAGHKKSDTAYELYSNNVDKFGLHVRSESIFIYNNKESVQRALQFWGLRWSNSWRKIRFKTFIFAAILQPFDGIYINLPEYFNNGTYPAVVESVAFEPESCLVSIEAWMPVIAGGYVIEQGAWPGPAYNIGPFMGKLY